MYTFIHCLQDSSAGHLSAFEHLSFPKAPREAPKDLDIWDRGRDHGHEAMMQGSNQQESLRLYRKHQVFFGSENPCFPFFSICKIKQMKGWSNEGATILSEFR